MATPEEEERLRQERLKKFNVKTTSSPTEEEKDNVLIPCPKCNKTHKRRDKCKPE